MLSVTLVSGETDSGVAPVSGVVVFAVTPISGEAIGFCMGG